MTVFQIKRTPTPGNQPPPNSLFEGELAVDMAEPGGPRLWVGVPASIDPTGQRVVSALGGPQDYVNAPGTQTWNLSVDDITRQFIVTDVTNGTERLKIAPSPSADRPLLIGVDGSLIVAGDIEFVAPVAGPKISADHTYMSIYGGDNNGEPNDFYWNFTPVGKSAAMSLRKGSMRLFDNPDDTASEGNDTKIQLCVTGANIWEMISQSLGSNIPGAFTIGWVDYTGGVQGGERRFVIQPGIGIIEIAATGELILALDPTSPMGAVTKQYVDALGAGGAYVPLDGSVPMTGPLTTTDLFLGGDNTGPSIAVGQTVGVDNGVTYFSTAKAADTCWVFKNSQGNNAVEISAVGIVSADTLRSEFNIIAGGYLEIGSSCIYFDGKFFAINSGAAGPDRTRAIYGPDDGTGTNYRRAISFIGDAATMRPAGSTHYSATSHVFGPEYSNDAAIPAGMEYAIIDATGLHLKTLAIEGVLDTGGNYNSASILLTSGAQAWDIAAEDAGSSTPSAFSIGDKTLGERRLVIEPGGVGNPLVIGADGSVTVGNTIAFSNAAGLFPTQAPPWINLDDNGVHIKLAGKFTETFQGIGVAPLPPNWSFMISDSAGGYLMNFTQNNYWFYCRGQTFVFQDGNISVQAGEIYLGGGNRIISLSPGDGYTQELNVWDGGYYNGPAAVRLQITGADVASTAHPVAGGENIHNATNHIFRSHDTLTEFARIDGTGITVGGVPIGTGGGGATVSDLPPATPTQGMLWFDSANLRMSVWYDDGTSQQWIAF